MNDELLEELRAIRRCKEYSQEYMATAMGISQNSYSRLEAGHTKMTVSKLLFICQLLEIELHTKVCNGVNAKDGSIIAERKGSGGEGGGYQPDIELLMRYASRKKRLRNKW